MKPLRSLWITPTDPRIDTALVPHLLNPGKVSEPGDRLFFHADVIRSPLPNILRFRIYNASTCTTDPLRSTVAMLCVLAVPLHNRCAAFRGRSGLRFT